MDADDFFLPEMLETAVSITEEENCETVVRPYTTFDSATKKILATLQLHDEVVDISAAKASLCDCIPMRGQKYSKPR